MRSASATNMASLVARAAFLAGYLSSAVETEALWLLKRRMWVRSWLQRGNSEDMFGGLDIGKLL